MFVALETGSAQSSWWNLETNFFLQRAGSLVLQDGEYLDDGMLKNANESIDDKFRIHMEYRHYVVENVREGHKDDQTLCRILQRGK